MRGSPQLLPPLSLLLYQGPSRQPWQQLVFQRDLHFVLNIRVPANSKSLLTASPRSLSVPLTDFGGSIFWEDKINPLGHLLHIFLHALKRWLQLPASHQPNRGFLGREGTSTALTLPQSYFISAPSQAKTPSVCHNYQMVF